MKILVTGGAGFIGSHIVESLVNQGHEVIVYDNLSSGTLDNLKKVSKDIKFIHGDILDYNSLSKAMKEIDVISHQAAQLEIFRCIEDPIMDLKMNTIGTLNVLRTAVKNNVRKIINASSACVYGQAKKIPQTEDHPKNPNWEYGVSKLATEKYCQIYQNNYNIPIISLRYAIVYGEREWFGRVLSIFIKRALLGQSLIIFGDGNQLRDFVYVKDVVDMHNRCIEKEKVDNIYNVGTGKGISINNLAEIVKEVSGKNIQIIHENVPEGKASKLFPERKRIPSELKQMVLDSLKAKRLGWKAKTELREGVKKEFEWASTNLRLWYIQKTVHV